MEVEHINDPYAQGYADCKEGKVYYPRCWISYIKDDVQLCHGSALTNYERGQYTLGWDAAIKGGAL